MVESTVPADKWDNFAKQIPEKMRPLYSLIRNYCLEISENVIEDIRMHRIVFCKSIVFRWFADVAPDGDVIVIKIQKGRKEPFEMIRVLSQDDFERAKPRIREAFEAVR